MSSISSDARFLGVDLQALWREVRQPWLQSHQWPVLAWLTPLPVIRLLEVEGKESYWLGDARPLAASAKRSWLFTAVELPEDCVLRRSLTVPVMGEADIANAVALQVRNASPFVAQDLAWGYRLHPASKGKHRIDVALVSRKQVGQHLASEAPRLQGVPGPEVWVRSGALPIVLKGYGNGQRASHAKRWRAVGGGLLLLACILMGAIAVTPAAQLRLRALEAAQAYAALGERTAPLARQREAFLQSTEQLGGLRDLLADRLEPLPFLAALTDILPDDTAIQGIKLQGSKVAITGATADSSALMQLLGKQPGLRDVRAPSAATRVPGATREAFSIEFTVDPRLFGPGGGSALANSGKAGEVSVVNKPVDGGVKAVAVPAASPVASAVAGPSFGTSRQVAPATPASGSTAKPVR